MLPVEAVGQCRLSRIAQTRRHGAGSLEYQQIRPWPLAVVENPGTDPGVAGKNIQHYGAARFEWITLSRGRLLTIETPDT